MSARLQPQDWRGCAPCATLVHEKFFDAGITFCSMKNVLDVFLCFFLPARMIDLFNGAGDGRQSGNVAFEGIEARSVDVQVQVAPGLPAFNMVGLPDKAVAEARERVRARR
jgi:hypothetical protein